MAFSGRDRSKSAGTAEEFIPLTSDQDGANPESSTSLGSLVTEASASGSPVAEGGVHVSKVLRSVNTEPVLSRDLSSSSQDSNVTNLSLIHDEVNKFFDADWRFEVDTLTTDPNSRDSRAPVLNLMGRECSKLALSEFYHMDEAEFSRHRRVSYPHIHQPLRSLSSKFLSKSGKAHKAKKKARKKKKKEKIRSFPSQSAIKSPTIAEEDEEYYMEYSDDSTNSSDSDDYLDDDFHTISAEQQALEANGGLSISRSVIPVMSVMPPTPEASPSPEGSSTLEKSSPENEQVLREVSSPDEHALRREGSPGYESINSESVSSGVDFYIGTDAEALLGDQVLPPFQVSPQFVDKEYSSADLIAVSDEEEAYHTDPGTPSTHEETAGAKKSAYRSTSELEHCPILSASLEEEPTISRRPLNMAPEDPDDRGTPSPQGYAVHPRKHSLRGKVTFVVGDDSAYPSNNNSQTELSDAGKGDAQEDGGHNSDKGGPWEGKKRRDSGRLNEDISAITPDSSPGFLRIPSSEGGQSTRSSKRRHHHHHEHFRTEDLIMRRQKGSEVKLDETFRRSPTETEEASLLYKADLDEMTSHRFEDQRGIRRHKIARKKGALHSIVHMGKSHHDRKTKVTKKFDHSPHEVFVELDELHFGGDDMMEWREKARWIKFEEDVEEGAERWGKPHVASLSFHSLLELRRGLERGTLLLDLEATDLTSIVHNVVESMVIRDLVDEESRGKLLRTLLLKHKHVNERSAFLRRTPSYSNLASLDSSGRRHQQHDKGLLNSISQNSIGSSMGLNKSPSQSSVSEKKNKDGKAAAKLEMVKVDVDNNMVFLYRIDETDKQTGGVHIGLSPVEQKKHVQDIMKRIPKGAEASTVLVGQVDFLKAPAMAFVRLSEGRILENLTEVPLPVRFIFILLGPEKGGMDYHEVGRSLSTLMSNQQFHEVAYRAESREDLLRAINNFLDDSIVLPPGDWDHRTLLPITHMARKRALMRKHKKEQFEEEEALLVKAEKSDIPSDPLQRTGCLFGGVINDVRRRYPYYLSDIKDAANVQSIKTLFFIFFTCLSPCIAFGGLLSEKTHSMMGVSETLVATSVFGMIFSLLSGQPLLIIGATGPVLVFEESLYKFCASNGFEFLPFRFWIGLWVCAITSIAVALESSFLVRYVTRFTEEIFAILISLIFIYEVVKKLMQIFSDHPLMEEYCTDLIASHAHNDTKSFNASDWIIHNGNSSGLSAENITVGSVFLLSQENGTTSEEDEVLNQPNTALLSLILVFGTFLIAYFLRVFRNSKFLGRSVRRALGDFGVLISLLSMVLLSIVMNKTYVQKLDITDPLTPTSEKRGWFINPMGMYQTTPLWLTFAAALPGFLIFILLFMETQITEMILNKKERKLKKGSGYHVDQLLLGFLTLLGGLFGLPWMCAATVRTVAHVSALSEYSRTHAPGEKPQLLGVKEQRVTNFAVHLFIGLSIGMGPVLQAIPVPALFGIFLYLGVSTLSGVQMCERIKLLLMPVKYHPAVGYVRKVRTMQMHKFTLIQLTCLLLLIVVKSTAASLAFPFMLILLVPFRLKVMPKFFDFADLSQLDNEEEELALDDEDDPDFYQQAHMPI